MRFRRFNRFEAVPLAKPVLIQGIVALVLLGLVLLLLVVGVMLVLEIRASLKEPSGGTWPGYKQGERNKCQWRQQLTDY